MPWHMQVPWFHSSAPQRCNPKRPNQFLTKGWGPNQFPLLPATETPHLPKYSGFPCEGEVPRSSYKCSAAMSHVPSRTNRNPHKAWPYSIEEYIPCFAKISGQRSIYKICFAERNYCTSYCYQCWYTAIVLGFFCLNRMTSLEDKHPMLWHPLVPQSWWGKRLLDLQFVIQPPLQHTPLKEELGLTLLWKIPVQ